MYLSRNDKWRIFLSGKKDALYNMALDRILLKRLSNGDSQHTLRLYGWQKPAISVGYGQDPYKILKIDRCRRDGISVVKRVTGGRAILHNSDLSYSVITHNSDPLFGGKLQDSYIKISELLCRGLNRLGVNAELSPRKRENINSSGMKLENRVTPCFLSVSRFEVTVGNRKIVGSAQRLTKECFLHHGSILLDDVNDKLLDYLVIVAEKNQSQKENQVKDLLYEEFRRHTITVSGILGRKVSFDEITENMLCEFLRTIPKAFVTKHLTDDENNELNKELTDNNPIFEEVAI